MIYETHTNNKTEQTEISFDFDSMDLDSSSMKVWERKEVAKNKRIVMARVRKQVMARAREIRKEAATKYGCNISEIIWGMCLKQAWRES